ncbi:MAG: serine hydrolase [Calditrichaeota bacterium]|nr:serine hydrolase [Calditrichota bacterium]
MFARADSVINDAITENLIPGAVLMVVKDQKIAYEKAYGNRQVLPEKKKMTAETIFDMASLTKPIATGTSMMILLERGYFRLLDKVEDYLPGYTAWQDTATGEKSDIRIIHLLTHTSGLPAYAHPDMLMKKYNSNSRDSLFKFIDTVERDAKPGTKFRYSGLNFITMQRIVEKLTGTTLAEFAQKEIFNKLEMNNTSYFLKPKQLENTAATEVIEGEPLVGNVHDPMARIVMKGNSANAGLFSDAEDLAVYAAMLLNGGSWNGKHILAPLTVKAFTSVPDGYEEFGRGLGWDLNSAYASNQGDLFSPTAFGHTGYTGTSIVIDPEYNLAVILLTNRVHPNDKGSVVRLRSIVSNLVAASINKVD